MLASSDSPATDGAGDRLKAIRSRFRAMLGKHRDHMIALHEEADSAPSDCVLSAISDRAHRIAGVAPTLGYTRMGQIAETIDGVISRGLRQRVPADVLWAQARPHLTDLEMVLALEE